MRAILQTIKKSFAFVGTTQTTAEVKHGIIIIQWQNAQKIFQLLKASADFRWIGFMGFGVGLVQLIQNGFAIAITTFKGGACLCRLLAVSRCYSYLRLLGCCSLISSSFTGSAYLPCSISLLRKWSKPQIISRYSLAERERMRFGCFIHRSAPSTRSPSPGCGCCSCAAPIPFGQ